MPLTGNTKKAVNQSITEYNGELMTIINMINIEKNEFSAFYEILKNYYDDLNILFSKVTDMIKNINENIDGLTPALQFSNLSVQEMENLIKIITKFISIHKYEIEKINDSFDDNAKKDIYKNLLAEIKADITTESEVDLIHQLAQKKDLGLPDNGKKTEKHIELF
jgi:hypothetical protein